MLAAIKSKCTLTFTDPERLEHVLKKIFSGTPDDRIKDIEEMLRSQEVYSGNDILVVNTMALRKGNLLSDAEVAKIEQHLRESNVVFILQFNSFDCISLIIYLFYILDYISFSYIFDYISFLYILDYISFLYIFDYISSLHILYCGISFLLCSLNSLFLNYLII